MEEKIKLRIATNGYIVEFKDGEIYVNTDFNEILNQMFGYLNEVLYEHPNIEITTSHKPFYITYNEKDLSAEQV